MLRYIHVVNFVRNNPNIVALDHKNGRRKFKTFSSSVVLKGKLTKSDVEGKIVMMGFLGPGNRDKFFTPLNSNPNEPDIYGLEYLANIVAQVIETK